MRWPYISKLFLFTSTYFQIVQSRPNVPNLTEEAINDVLHLFHFELLENHGEAGIKIDQLIHNLITWKDEIRKEIDRLTLEGTVHLLENRQIYFDSLKEFFVDSDNFKVNETDGSGEDIFR